MENLSLETLKEPSSSNGLNSRRHTVSIHRDKEFGKVPPSTQAAIEKVVETVTRMGGEMKTHVKDNGGTSILLHLSSW
jgi:hypothetical protein